MEEIKTQEDTVQFSQTPQIPLENEQHKKEAVIKRKKALFITTLLVILGIIGLFLFSGGAYYIYKNFLAPKTPIVVTQKPDITQLQQNPEVLVEKTIQYKSDNLKLALVYQKEAKLIDTWESPNQTKKLEIFFSRDGTAIQKNEGIKDSEISEGYVFRISTFTTSIRNIDEIAKVKKESVKANCPETAEFTETYGTQINGIDSRVFEVKNCNGDLTVTYTPKFGVFYEFEQIYKGDLGYKQKQKASTQEILDSVRFYPEPTGPEEPYETYKNDSFGFSFEHPKFDSSCCDLAGPPTTTNIEKVIVLADKETFVSKTDFDGIAVYIYRLRNEETYQNFLEKQKKTLIDDYIVVRGSEPKLQEVGIKVDDKDAVMLKGYSWRDVDLIYTEVVRGNGQGYALIISVKRMTGDKFDEKVDGILSSFKFY
jgi:hypothetical protein